MVKLAFRIDLSGVPSTFRPTGSTLVARIQKLESRHINSGVCPGSLGFFSTFGTRSDVFDLRSIAGSIFRWAALGCHVRIIIPAHDGPGGVPVSTFEKVVGGQHERRGCCHRLVEDQPIGNRLCQRLWKRLSEHVVSQWSLTSRFRSAASQSRSSAMASLCDRSKGPVRCRPDFPKLISPSFSVCESLGWHDPGFQLGSTNT